MIFIFFLFFFFINKWFSIIKNNFHSNLILKNLLLSKKEVENKEIYYI